VGITLARCCWDWACRKGTTRTAVEISPPRAGRCGASERAGGGLEEGNDVQRSTFKQQQQQQQPPSPSHPYRYFVFSQSNTTPNHPENLTIDTAFKNPII